MVIGGRTETQIVTVIAHAAPYAAAINRHSCFPKRNQRIHRPYDKQDQPTESQKRREANTGKQSE